MTRAVGDAAARRPLAGIALVMIAAIGFGFVAYFSRTAYAGRDDARRAR